MRRFDRSRIPRPSTFDGAPPDPTPATWNYSHLNKGEIRERLHELQGGCCAYCERSIGIQDEECHIEHLWRQNDFKEKDVDWNNMFLSCNTPVTCGKSKDKKLGPPVKNASAQEREARRAQMERIIDPSRDNPEVFLHFASDGKVHPRPEDPASRARAVETIALFRLDAPGLCRDRQNAVTRIKSMIGFLASEAPEKIGSFINNELSQLPTSHFASVLRAYLQAIPR